jgi:hypothetical protein
MKRLAIVLIVCAIILALFFNGNRLINSLLNQQYQTGADEIPILTPIPPEGSPDLSDTTYNHKPNLSPTEFPQEITSSEQIETPTTAPVPAYIESPKKERGPLQKKKPGDREVSQNPKKLLKKRENIVDLAAKLQNTPPKQTRVKLNIASNIDELLKDSNQLQLRENEDDHTVTINGLWRGDIKLSKDINYLLIINRPWDFLSDEYLASSCVGIEEGGVTVYQKSLYNSLKFYEIKSMVNGNEVFSLVCIIGDKYVLNVALPASEGANYTNGIAYFKKGKKLQYLGLIDLNRDTEYPNSECTDFEYKW